MGGDLGLCIGWCVTTSREGIGIGSLFISSINYVPNFPCLGPQGVYRLRGGGDCGLSITSPISFLASILQCISVNDFKLS